MIALSRVQTDRAVAYPGKSQAETRYFSAKDVDIAFDAGFVLLTSRDKDGAAVAQTIIPIGNVDFMAPIEPVEPRRK